MAFKSDERLEPIHEIQIAANETANAEDKDIFVDEILRKEVTEFEKLIHGLLVADVLLDTIEESKLFRACARCRSRWQRLRNHWCKCW